MEGDLHLGYMPCYFALAWLPGASRNQLCSRQVQFWRPSTTPAWHGTATALPSTTPRRRPLTPPFNPARRFSHLQSLVSSSASSVLRPASRVQRPASSVLRPTFRRRIPSIVTATCQRPVAPTASCQQPAVAARASQLRLDTRRQPRASPNTRQLASHSQPAIELGGITPVASRIVPQDPPTLCGNSIKQTRRPARHTKWY